MIPAGEAGAGEAGTGEAGTATGVAGAAVAAAGGGPDPVAGVPLRRGLGQRPGQHGVGCGGQAGPPRPQRGHRLGQVRVDDRHTQATRVHRLAAQQLEGRAGKPVLIRPAGDRLALDLLRRGVVRGAHELPGSGVHERRREGALAEPEVGQVHVIGPARPGVQQDVGGLDVPVHQARRVRRVQRGGHR
jgi:hypothetical protein